MKIHLVAATNRGPAQPQSTFVIDDTVAVDAGCLTQLPLDDQRRIRHVFLSHSHLDHIATLPMFLDNVYELGPQAPYIYASPFCLDVLQRHFFNGHVWPDFVRLGLSESPFMRLVPLQAEQPVDADGITVWPVELSHTVPTFGFVLESNQRRVAILSDTGPTHRVWEFLQQRPPDLLMLDLSFPDSMAWLAEQSKHLSPRTFVGELAKLQHSVPTVAIHIKPAFYEQVRQEFLALGLPNAQLAHPGDVWEI
jgi:ribonuclease BN (tRNA processing enzyme)